MNTEWQDIVIPKPKEPYKQNLPFKQIYNEYGFNQNDSMYSLVEENRDFRKYIENEIRMEEVKTQNILGQHITDEVNRNIRNTNAHASEIKEKIDSHHNYVVETIQPKTDKIDNIEQNVNSIKQVVNNIWNRIINW